jgi:hypothetical protein
MDLDRGADYGMAELVGLLKVWMHDGDSLKGTEGNKGNEEERDIPNQG